MRRLSFLGLCVLFVVIIGGVYRIANQYQIIERQVNRFDTAAEQEHENIRVLQAEWAFLTNPVRLEKIARDNFQLQPVDGRQVVAVVDIPVRAALDAQDAETKVADNDEDAKTPSAAPQKSLPHGVTPIASAQPDVTTVATALPAAATQALPPIDATPVSDQREAR